MLPHRVLAGTLQGTGIENLHVIGLQHRIFMFSADMELVEHAVFAALDPLPIMPMALVIRVALGDES